MAQTVVGGVETTAVVFKTVGLMEVVVTGVDGVVVVVGKELGVVVVCSGVMGDLGVVVTVVGGPLTARGVVAGALIPAQKFRKGFRSVTRICTAVGMSCLLLAMHDWH